MSEIPRILMQTFKVLQYYLFQNVKHDCQNELVPSKFLARAGISSNFDLSSSHNSYPIYNLIIENQQKKVEIEVSVHKKKDVSTLA